MGLTDLQGIFGDVLGAMLLGSLAVLVYSQLAVVSARPW